MTLHWCYLGLTDYRRALALQEAVRAAILAGRAPDTLLLTQHTAVITLGRSARPEHVLVSAGERARRGVDLVQVGRGGDVTLHGPGQLVGYPIRRVGRRVEPHVRAMAESLVALLADRGVTAWWREDHPGVWCAAGKIAAVGVDARDGVAIHGFALNVTVDLALFNMIVPCGLQAPVTSLQALIGVGDLPAVEELGRAMVPLLSARLGEDDAREVTLAELLAVISGSGALMSPPVSAGPIPEPGS